MNKEKRSKYSEILLNAYQSGVFKIVWNTSGFSMAIDPRKKEMIPEIKDDDFVEYAFSIIRTVADLAEDRETDDKDEGDLATAKMIFDKEYDLKNHLYIKKNSIMECYKLLEYEIISHRSQDNPSNIEATSAVVKIMVEKEDEETLYAFETSKRDLEDMINKLVELNERLNTLQ